MRIRSPCYSGSSLHSSHNHIHHIRHIHHIHHIRRILRSHHSHQKLIHIHLRNLHIRTA